MTLPTYNGTMPIPSRLNGVPNGRLPNNLLVPAFIPGNNWLMFPAAARAMRAMVAAMSHHGFKVRATGTYRSYAEQLSLFTSRYQPVSYAKYLATPASRRKKWDAAKAAGFSSVYWVKKKNINGSYPATAATPGNSDHGLALAVDLAEERDNDVSPESVSASMVGWLVANAGAFGYIAELQSEPWHWVYFAGDNIPAAVVAFETGLQSVPPVDPGMTVPDDAVAQLTLIAQAIAQAKTFTLREPMGGPNASQAERDAVSWCQVALKNAKYPLEPNGVFDSKTALAVCAFQKDRCIPVDGVVGPQTWGKLWP
jgi:LAS superfamily LD-carboxypeptidase LdcB